LLQRHSCRLELYSVNKINKRLSRAEADQDDKTQRTASWMAAAPCA